MTDSLIRRTRVDPAGGDAAGQEFASRAEPYRRELQAYCYRMLGSLQDAEDLVQETLLRAWRKLDTYEGRASFRAWLYKIATNACLDALARRPRRVLPKLRETAPTAGEFPGPPVMEPIWLEPFPDELLAGAEMNPEARYAARESITLAFVAALQSLTPRQRAILILRDVLDWRASEVASLLNLSVPAVNSALHRARVTMGKNYGTGHPYTLGATPADEATRQLLNRYVQAWEAADVSALVAVLKEDATLSMPPSPSWYQGRASIGWVVAGMAFGGEARGRWRLVPTEANGQPAFGLYMQEAAGRPYRAAGIQVIQLEGGAIAEMVTFFNPALVEKFGLPSQLDSASESIR